MAILFTASACASGATPVATPASPQLLALSSYEASLGTLVSVYGDGFLEDARYWLVFDGTFEGPSGTEPVHVRSGARRIDAGELAWDQFGPYDVPFSSRGANVGVFRGTASVEREERSGEVVASEPVEMTFEVLPSIIVRELQPITASCAEPVTRGLGSVPYRMSVEAIGFEPERFTYTILTPSLGDDFPPRVERHLVEGRFDVLGARGDWVLPAVPEGYPSYGMVVVVEALDASGRTVRNSFAIRVHRPIEVFYNGAAEVAQFLEPQPVSACMAGGLAGVAVTYSESNVETRSRSYSLSWNQSWLNTHTVSEGSTETHGSDLTNGVGVGVSLGSSVAWQVGGEVSGSIGVDGLISTGMKVSGSWTDTQTMARDTSQSATEGLNESHASTDTESTSGSVGGGSNEDFSWSVSSSDSIARGFGGVVIAGTYGIFYRQAVRLIRHGAVVTYNQCGAAEVVGDLNFTDWVWAADLALANQCPPLPVSNLPPAQCVVPPCD